MSDYWISRVFSIEDINIHSLIAKLNKFYEDKFVIATQTHYINNKWVAIVYYKIQKDALK